MSASVLPHTPDTGPVGSVGSMLRRSFATPLNAAITIVVAAAVIAVAVPVLRWALVDAVWRGSADACRADGAGACWTFVGHKLRFILFGLYPPAERWRAGLAVLLLVAMVVLTASPRAWRRWLLGLWIGVLAATYWLMRGGLGLPVVPTRQWGGLPVTLLLTTIGLAAGFPLGIVLALGRRSSRPVPRLIAAGIVEVVRGVPLIAVLYVAALLVPLAMPAGVEVDKLLLAQLGVAVFAAAYLAEAVRAGLQIIRRGQGHAALALGLTRWQTMRLVILPQALRVVIPSFVSIAIGFFQDTSLIAIIGLFDLLGTARIAAQDPEWLGFHTEAFMFVGVLYYLGSAVLARYGLRVERRLGSR
jgi:general L-amino acid transport system permease protein